MKSPSANDWKKCGDATSDRHSPRIFDAHQFALLYEAANDAYCMPTRKNGKNLGRTYPMSGQGGVHRVIKKHLAQCSRAMKSIISRGLGSRLRPQFFDVNYYPYYRQGR